MFCFHSLMPDQDYRPVLQIMRIGIKDFFKCKCSLLKFLYMLNDKTGCSPPDTVSLCSVTTAKIFVILNDLLIYAEPMIRMEDVLHFPG